MRAALDLAGQAFEEGEVPVGAVIVHADMPGVNPGDEWHKIDKS